MTTAVVFIQRSMILVIVLCYFHARSETIDCDPISKAPVAPAYTFAPPVSLEGNSSTSSNRTHLINSTRLYPFHYTCRGMMSRKRAMLPNPLYAQNCDGSRTDLNCIKTFEQRRHQIPYVPLPKSRFLVALLDNNLQKDSAYNARHRQRNNDEIHGRRTPLMENFLSELAAEENDY